MSGRDARVVAFPRMVHPVERPEMRLRVLENATPQLEALASIGDRIPESERRLSETGQMAGLFKKERGALLEQAIEAHVRRHMDMFYMLDDPDGAERKRTISVLTASIYLHNTVSLLWEKAKGAGDAGSSALFRGVLEQAHALLGEEFYTQSVQELADSFRLIGPALGACLRRFGMEMLPLPAAIEAHAQELVDRSQEVNRRLHEQQAF